MKITKLTLQNFKGIGPKVEIPLSPVTLLFGKNSAGKSTVLHSLLYAQELLEHRKVNVDRTALGGDTIDLGGYHSLVHQGCEEEGFKIRFELDYASVNWVTESPIDEFVWDFKVGEEVRVVDLSERGTEATSGWVEFHIATNDGEPIVHSIEIGSDGNWLARIGYFSSRDSIQIIEGKNHGRIFLNEIHPALCLPGEEAEVRTGNLYGMWGRSFQTAYYHIFFDEERLVGSVDLTQVNELLKNDATDEELLSFRINNQQESECSGMIGRFGSNAIEISNGTKEQRELRIERIFTSSKENATSLLFQLDSVDECPVINLLGDGIPDLTRPLSLGWPLDVLDEDLEEDEMKKQAQSYRFVVQLLDRLVLGPMKLLKKQLDGMRYVGPLRKIPSRQYVAPLTYIPGRWAEGLGAWDALSRDPSLFNSISEVMRDKLKLRYSIQRREIVELDLEHEILAALNFSVKQYEDQDAGFLKTNVLDAIKALPSRIRVSLRDEESGALLKPNDVGVGLSQLIPVVVGALAPNLSGNPNQIFAVEQPELHVHPAIQVGLVDVFIEANRETGRMMLIETHSEHLLLRLLRRVRESSEDGTRAFTKDDLSVLYVVAGETGVEITDIPVSDDGDFNAPWPEGFFEERDSELF